MSTHSELIASKRSVDEIREIIGADELSYQTVSGLIDALGYPKEETCLACLTGEYPTPLAQRVADETRGKPQDQNARYWETYS